MKDLIEILPVEWEFDSIDQFSYDLIHNQCKIYRGEALYPGEKNTKCHICQKSIPADILSKFKQLNI